MAIDVLLRDKGDSEILQALVYALTDDGQKVLENFVNYSTTTRHGANVEIVRTICQHQLNRVKAGPPVPNQDLPPILVELKE